MIARLLSMREDWHRVTGGRLRDDFLVVANAAVWGTVVVILGAGMIMGGRP